MALISTLFAVECIIHLNGKFEGKRELADRFSNGDPNKVNLIIKHNYILKTEVKIIDEIPIQFQKRDFEIKIKLERDENYNDSYFLTPVERGEYHFGIINLFVNVLIGLISFRYKLGENATIAVYPSFFQLKKIEMIAFTNSLNAMGYKKIRRIGNNREFEQIKDYVSGDDYRKINWKATARQNKLMINEFQEERSQNIFQIIDMGRTMKMPFEDMTLLDYSINSTLAISNIILKKHDKIGLITYSNKVHSFLPAGNRKNHINNILETLYDQSTLFKESNLEKVYTTLRKNTQGRSLLIFYTNFESVLGLERQLPILKKLAKMHLILLVSFVNTELTEIVQKSASTIEDIYLKTIAEKNILEKNLFMEQLNHFGILNLRVKPNELTISVLNKYLEIKNRGLI
ncbi:MAG: DUF58 domain-containing protein [Bacteroidales bacterium]|nr:DUF58 domain-containing protein [Bacteroidales bacterium]